MASEVERLRGEIVRLVFSDQDAWMKFPHMRLSEFEAAVRAEERERIAHHADRLAATVVLLAHDAHPVYANTTGWRGGVGGQAVTPGCSIIDPAPGEDWTQYDLPTHPAREWLNGRAESGRPVDLEAVKASIKAELVAMLAPEDGGGDDG